MNAPIQARAQLTEDLLLDAAETLLRKGGEDACTMPEVAHHAGRSIGALYKRFPDKDALLRKVFSRYFARTAEHNAAMMDQLDGLPLPALLSTMIHGMVHGQRRERRLLGAFHSFVRSHPDKAFRREAHRMSGAALARFRELVLAHRNAIKHPDPETAVDTALATLSLTIQGWAQAGDESPLARISEETQARELTR
ncbi:MAG: TetR/AcrR family transcriptional regulator, partial [Alphaproteobacteria bacterium]|nr:TetR/AcrR family transcriptional regulator [Alphaproteobacteria bacterium]